MNTKLACMLICLASSAGAAEFSCQQYQFSGANEWLCAHIGRTEVVAAPAEGQPDGKHIEQQSKRAINELLRQAESSYVEGDYSRVEQIYRQIIKQYPVYAGGWLKLAQLYSDLNREPDALQVLQQSLLTITDNADVFHEMGLLQVRAGHFAKAVISLAKAAIKAPENAHYNYVYAIALNSSQRPYKALDVLLQAYQRQPNNMQILGALFSINHDLSRHANALFWAQKILLIEPDNESAQQYVKKF